MSEQVSFTAQVKVSGGPSLPISLTLTPGGYDKLRATIPAGTTLAMHVQPVAGLARLLVVTASAYADEANSGQTLAVEFGQADGTTGEFLATTPSPPPSPISLDGPLVITGKGVLASLAEDWTMLQFTNDLPADVTVDILVCREL